MEKLDYLELSKLEAGGICPYVGMNLIGALASTWRVESRAIIALAKACFNNEIQ